MLPRFLQVKLKVRTKLLLLVIVPLLTTTAVTLLALNKLDSVSSSATRVTEERLEPVLNLNRITRHILGLYQGVPGARKFRRHLSENAYRKGAGTEILSEAYALVRGSYEQQT